MDSVGAMDCEGALEGSEVGAGVGGALGVPEGMILKVGVPVGAGVGAAEGWLVGAGDGAELGAGESVGVVVGLGVGMGLGLGEMVGDGVGSLSLCLSFRCCSPLNPKRASVALSCFTICLLATALSPMRKKRTTTDFHNDSIGETIFIFICKRVINRDCIHNSQFTIHNDFLVMKTAKLSRSADHTQILRYLADSCKRRFELVVHKPQRAPFRILNIYRMYTFFGFLGRFEDTTNLLKRPKHKCDKVLTSTIVFTELAPRRARKSLVPRACTRNRKPDLTRRLLYFVSVT
jgi:hypothetical protein